MASLMKRAALWLAAPALLAGAAAIYLSLPSRPAGAAGLFGRPTVQSSGPIQLNAGENARFGFLLPAVQHLAMPARFEIVDGTGQTIFSSRVAMGDGSVRSLSFFDVFFTNDPASGRSILEIRAGDGSVLKQVPGSDGALIGLLLPAVQRGGMLVGPTAASVQIMRGGERGQIVGMCDGSV